MKKLAVLLLASCAAQPVGVADVTVALVCDEAPVGGDSADSVPDCDAALVGEDGVARRIGRGGLLAAMRLDERRLLLLTRDLRMVTRDDDGHETLVAAAAADPRTLGLRVVYTQLPAGTTELTPGTTGPIVLLDLERGTRRVVTAHPMDSSPFLIPDSDDVLFVSARTGVASLWLAEPGRPARQLTNVGMRRVGPGFVPVPGRTLAFTPGTRTAVYGTSYGGVEEVWSVDLGTGSAQPIMVQQ